jgi:hypothetical protein
MMQGRDDPKIEEADLPPPTGTIFLLTIYVAVIAGMWGAMYLMMLSR